jgi:hypothetical protein
MKTTMKKVCICVALLAMAFCGQAQSKVNIGVKAGGNFSTWTGYSINDVDIRSSYHAGVFAQVSVSKSFLLQPEILFSNEGTTFEKGKIVVHYIKMPLLFRYQHVSGFHMEAGPQLGFRLKATAMFDGDPDQDAKNIVNPLETSLSTGLGFQWSPDWDVSLRYNAGLSLVAEGEDKIRTSVIGLSLAYRFR